MDDRQTAILQAIRARMEARHVSALALSKFAGMPYSTCTRSLDGFRAFTLPEFFLICAALNCSPDDLLGDVAA